MTRNDGYYAVRGHIKVTNFGTALGVTPPFVLNPRDLYYRGCNNNNNNNNNNNDKEHRDIV